MGWLASYGVPLGTKARLLSLLQLQQHPVLVKYIDSVAAATRTTVPKRPPRAHSGWERTAEENPTRCSFHG